MGIISMGTIRISTIHCDSLKILGADSQVIFFRVENIYKI
jgi:hypothetical protein